jgi:hypothetical protein
MKRNYLGYSYFVPFILWSDLATKTLEMMLASAQVIGHRTGHMALARPFPDVKQLVAMNARPSRNAPRTPVDCQLSWPGFDLAACAKSLLRSTRRNSLTRLIDRDHPGPIVRSQILVTGGRGSTSTLAHRRFRAHFLKRFIPSTADARSTCTRHGSTFRRTSRANDPHRIPAPPSIAPLRHRARICSSLCRT